MPEHAKLQRWMIAGLSLAGAKKLQTLIPGYTVRRDAATLLEVTVEQ
jgi:hypothetical protein